MVPTSLLEHPKASRTPGGVPKKEVNKTNKDFFANFSLKFRVLKLRFLAFVEGPEGFRELREAGMNHFHLSWYLLVPGITSSCKKPTTCFIEPYFFQKKTKHII